MTRERGPSRCIDVVLDIVHAEAPVKLCRPPMASREHGRMLAFASFHGFIWRNVGKVEIDHIEFPISPS